jgi:ABC-2 type transport system permease protein
MQFLHRVLYYWKLFCTFAKMRLAVQMEYRINFLSGLLVEAGYFIIKMMYPVICYQNDVHIGNLDPNGICIITGTYCLLTGIYMFFYTGFITLADKVRNGALDLLITKPVSSQFMLTMTDLSFGMLATNSIGGLVLIIYGWHGANISLTLSVVAGFIALVLSSSLLTYSLFLFPLLLSFKMLSAQGLNAFLAAVWDFNNMPMALYGRGIRFAGLFIFPVFIISNWPGLFLLGSLSPLFLAYGFIAAIGWFIITRILWKHAIKGYASANG